MNYFGKIPFVRLLIPYVSGILLCSALSINENVIIALTGVFAAMAFVFFLNKRSASVTGSSMFILLSDVFLFLSALYSFYCVQPKNNFDFYGHYVTKGNCTWIAETEELPVEKEKFSKVALQVKSLRIGNEMKFVNGRVLAYFKNPCELENITPGSILEINSEFLVVPKPLNPNEFDYKYFLEKKGIYYQTFIESENHKLLSKNIGFTLKNLGLKIKKAILNRFDSPMLDRSAAQLCSALLTGYDDEINKETINAFAHSGTLHVLSVSGLHTGIIYAVLVFLLGIIDKRKKYKVLHLLVLLTVLFLLVLVTGFSPPVLRAVIMLALLTIGKYYYNYLENASLNILAVSAFVILLFDPLLIYDVGFLLSYTAMLGLLLFGPYFNSLFISSNRYINWIWKLCAASLAAQLSTLPVTLFFFHQFPWWFVFSNLLIIPLCTLLMFFGFLFLLKLNFVAFIVNKISVLIFHILQVTNVPDWGYIDKVDFGKNDLFFMIFVIMAAALFVKHRSFSLAKVLLILIVSWQCFSLLSVYNNKSNSFLGIYQINKASAVDCKNASILICSSEVDNNGYDYHIKQHQATYNYPLRFRSNFDYVKSGNISFLHVRSEQELPLIEVLKPQVVLFSHDPQIGNNYTFDYKPEKIIADGSNSYYFVKSLRSISEKQNIPFYSTKESGYIRLNL